MTAFIHINDSSMNITVKFHRYLQEFTMLGTAGGMYHFRDQIRVGNPTAFFVLNGDVCSDFPLNELYEFHKSKNGKAEVGNMHLNSFQWFFNSLVTIVCFRSQ